MENFSKCVTIVRSMYDKGICKAKYIIQNEHGHLSINYCYIQMNTWYSKAGTIVSIEGTIDEENNVYVERMFVHN